ncbi:MAG: YfiR family protein [Pseudomonadota bacterium]
MLTIKPVNWVLVVWCTASAFASAGSAMADDHAAMLTKVARFTSWPTDLDYGLSFRICLRDDDPAFSEFAALEGSEIQGLPVTVHSIPPQSFGRRPCHAAYFSVGYASDDIMKALRRSPTLTISQQEHFALSGGVIEIVHRGRERALRVNSDVVAHHPLRLRAPLREVAEEVTP